jgi:hypothetical protein
MRLSSIELHNIIQEEIEQTLIDEGFTDWMAGLFGGSHTDDVKTKEEKESLNKLEQDPKGASKMANGIIDWLIKRVLHQHKDFRRDFRDLLSKEGGLAKATKEAKKIINGEWKMTKLVSVVFDQIVDNTRVDDQYEEHQEAEDVKEVIKNKFNITADMVQALYNYMKTTDMFPIK